MAIIRPPYFNDGTASAISGSKTVNFSGISVTLFRQGDLFFQGGASEVIDSINSGGNYITLLNNWGGATTTSQPYSVVPTPEDVELAVTTREWLQYLNGPILSIAQMMGSAEPDDGDMLVWDSGEWVAQPLAGGLLSLLDTDDDILQRKDGEVVGRTPSQVLADLLAGNSSGTGSVALVTDATLSGVTLSGTTVLNGGGRIDTNGNLLIATSTNSFGHTLVVAGSSAQGIISSTSVASNDCFSAWNQADSGNNTFCSFYTEASITTRGSITYNRSGGLVAYNTTSDYRLKDIESAFTGSAALIDTISVYFGRMKGATVSRPMFIAHEVSEGGMPWAVTGEKDAEDADGNIVPQQLNESALIATLWAEVKSLRARMAALEGDV